MITLTGFAQVGSQRATDAGSTPIDGNADEGGLHSLTAFDDVLLQVWEPHQPISLRPAVVMDLIARFDGNNVASDVTMQPPTDEQNQQLLDVLLQFHGQKTPPQTAPPVTIVPFPHAVDSHLTIEPPPVVMDQVTQDKSSPIINSLIPARPNLEVMAQPAVTRAESLPGIGLQPEGISAVMPAALSNTTNSSNEVAVPRMESQLNLANSPKEWSQQLRTVLGERLQMQIESKVQHATIRLDPPDMGKIDISLHMEGGKLQVHINASQGDVYRALQQTSAELRQTLIGQNSATVEVQISANSQQQQQQQRQDQQQQPDILAALHIETQVGTSTDDGTLLITV
ncbi:flagellar hook-length control protein FliK [Yersinia pekkanenii]|uniref:Flagellar hook-length control protein FliK n=1 Tax=Yersinia pekkanenii TaxID=1288385 RepID=A0A0T9P4F7_9GAMM|nr:flagellar hook-length control protein FliK [Yersinia pekkanenii]CNH44525.1 flagellar hook-length control protein FliK [Yersinia pekkanenii]CRY67666.1 flagellar hook-length control protein FliK [Yersinia pekkanenii]